jgi:hypothetical protein
MLGTLIQQGEGELPLCEKVGGYVLHSLFVVLTTAVLSSCITMLCAWLWLKHSLRREMESRLRELHDDIGRTVEIRTRKAVVEAMSDIKAGDVIRDATWKAARSGSDMLTEGLAAIFNRRRGDKENMTPGDAPSPDQEKSA